MKWDYYSPSCPFSTLVALIHLGDGHFRTSPHRQLIFIMGNVYIYRLGYVKGGSTTFKVQKDGCGPTNLESSNIASEDGLYM